MVRGAVAVLRDDEVQAVIDQAITRRVVAQQWGPPMGSCSRGSSPTAPTAGSSTSSATAPTTGCATTTTTVMTLVSKQAPSWSPRFVEGLIGDRLYAEALSFAWAVKTDPDHPLRGASTGSWRRFAGDLQSDEDTMARVESIKTQLLEHPDVAGPHRDGVDHGQGDAARRRRGPVQ